MVFLPDLSIFLDLTSGAYPRGALGAPAPRGHKRGAKKGKETKREKKKGKKGKKEKEERKEGDKKGKDG